MEYVEIIFCLSLIFFTDGSNINMLFVFEWKWSNSEKLVPQEEVRNVGIGDVLE